MIMFQKTGKIKYTNLARVGKLGGMDRKPPPLLPGQVERIDYDIDQLRALTSAARYEVFWSIPTAEARSISEIAQALGRPASSVTYHVNELVQVGLLIQVGERKRRSRTEALYAPAAQRFFSKTLDQPERRALIFQGMEAMMRSMGREAQGFFDVQGLDPELEGTLTFRRYSAKVTRQQLLEFNQKIVDLLLGLAQTERDEDGRYVTLVYYTAPTLAETRRVKKRGGSDPET